MGKWVAALFFLSAAVFFWGCGMSRGDALIIHYYRYGGDYGGWNFWVWPAPDGEGRAVFFGRPDAEGFVTARTVVTKRAAGKAGFILRKSEKDNEWAAKDGNAVRFSDTSGEIWILQGDGAVYHEKPDVKHPPIAFAAADSQYAVSVYLVRPPLDYGSFAVYRNEQKVSGESIRGGLDNEVIVSLTEIIADPSDLLVIKDESGEFLERNVTMRRVLDSFSYDGDDLGLVYSKGRGSFKVWSPAARAVELMLYDEGQGGNEDGKSVSMERNVKTGVWHTAVDGGIEGKFYLYKITFPDGGIRFAVDPYAKAVSANGARGAVIDLAGTNPDGWKQGSKPPFSVNMQDAVLYETHVRDFSVDPDSGMKHKGKFLAFSEAGTKNKDGVPTGISHLVKLGVTHVHLLPSYDFASVNELTVDDPKSADPKYNWGYDPKNYNVPEGSYSTDPSNPAARILEFKRMVKSLHDAGIRVVMDVVYNHTYETGGGPFDDVVPGYYYRTFPNGDLSNGSGCGNEVASERPMAGKFIIDSCKYWLKEYDVDGFRFDLMALIDRPTMIKLTSEIRAIYGGDIIIYGEPWQAGGSTLDFTLQTGIGTQRGLGFAVFNDRIRGAIKGGGNDDASRGFASGAPDNESGIVRGFKGSVDDICDSADESVNYVTCHDNLNLWDKIAVSLGARDIKKFPYRLIDKKKPLYENDAARSSMLANAIVLTSQGIPFFQAGDEFFRTKFGDHNSYKSSDSINMIRWENAALYAEAVEYYAGLIKLRREHPAFRMSKKADIDKIETLISGDMVVAMKIPGAINGDIWHTVIVAYNGAAEDRVLPLPDGDWDVVAYESKAGVETLRQANGEITLPRLSAAVLHN